MVPRQRPITVPGSTAAETAGTPIDYSSRRKLACRWAQLSVLLASGSSSKESRS